MGQEILSVAGSGEDELRRWDCSSVSAVELNSLAIPAGALEVLTIDRDGDAIEDYAL